MSSLRFIHAADLHLDSPFTGIKSTNDTISQHLCDATFKAYKNIIDLCLVEKVDALLLAGDLYDGADRSLRAQLALVYGLNRLDEAGIRSFICFGNHDPLSGWEAKLDLPPLCHRYGPDVEAIPLDPDNPGKAMVYGVSYPKRDVQDNLAQRFHDLHTNGAFTIGLLHCNVAGNTEHERYAPCSMDDLTGNGIDYWALGHVHTRQVPREQGPAIVYPGNPQGRNPKETGERGVYLVEVNDLGRVRLDFRPVDTVRWQQLDLIIDELSEEQALIDRADEEVDRLLTQTDGRHLVYTLNIKGRGPLHKTVQRTDFQDDLQERINDTWSERDPFAWCERLQVTTSPPIDREELRQAEDFVGDLLRFIDGAKKDDALLSELGEELQALLGHSQAKRYLDESALTQENLLQWMADAETRCLDHLIQEEES